MHLYGIRVFERPSIVARTAGIEVRGQAGHGRLRAVAALMLGLVAGVPSGLAQQATPEPPQSKAASNLPSAPPPIATEPLDLRQTQRDFSRPAHSMLSACRMDRTWRPKFRRPVLLNSVRLTDLVKEGKIYLSLSDALALAIENNYDIAIARYNLDIADTDILRAKAGQLLARREFRGGDQHPGRRRVDFDRGRRTGRHHGGIGRRGFGQFRTGALDQRRRPVAGEPGPGGDRNHPVGAGQEPQSNILFSGGKSALTTNTDAYNFTFNQGFVTGTALQVGFNNSRITSDNPFNSSYSPTN